MPNAQLQDLISDVLKRAPEWVRAELASRDPTSRNRAEETLAAMIAAAIDTGAQRTSKLVP